MSSAVVNGKRRELIRPPPRVVSPSIARCAVRARESTLRERQLDHQLTDLRARVASIGGTVDREIPENAVSAFKRKCVQLPDGTSTAQPERVPRP